MANTLYTKAKEKMLCKQLDFTASAAYPIKAALVKSTYPLNLADEFFSSVSSYVVGTPQTLANRTITGGVFDADDVTFAALTAGDTCGRVVLYVATGDNATSSLVASIDTITGFPLTTNGGDVVVRWDNGAYKIFSL